MTWVFIIYFAIAVLMAFLCYDRRSMRPVAEAVVQAVLGLLWPVILLAAIWMTVSERLKRGAP